MTKLEIALCDHLNNSLCAVSKLKIPLYDQLKIPLRDQVDDYSFQKPKLNILLSDHLKIPQKISWKFV